MGKYKDVLVRKLEQEKKDENEQARLRKETGIKNQAYRLKERSLKSYVKSSPVRHGLRTVYGTGIFRCPCGITSGIKGNPNHNHPEHASWMKRFPTCYEQKSAENDQKVLSAKKIK